MGLFQVGDLIVYGSEGVCRVEAIGCPDIESANQERQYYTLAPLYREGRTYTPVDTTVFMRPVITCEQAERLISDMPGIQPDVSREGNLRVQTERYEEFLNSRDCVDLVRLIRTVYTKREESTDKRRKLGLIDERYMKRAEEMLYGELAVALDIDRDEVEDYITRRIQEMQGDEPHAQKEEHHA